MLSDNGLQIAAVCVFAIIVIIGIAWILMPLVIFSRLKKIDDRLLRSDKTLSAIEKNTADVAKFFNEKDVRIEG